MRRTAAAAAIGAGVLLTSSCVADSSDEATQDDVADEPTISVTVPAERLTPFCEAMIDVSDQLRSGGVEDANALIIETYRAIRGDVPLEIATDFDLVLEALEAGVPPPTDPPAESQVLTPESVVEAVTGSEPTVTFEASIDEGFDPDTSPTDRINSYVEFSCRSTGNNPGPPATQPLDDVPTTDT